MTEHITHTEIVGTVQAVESAGRGYGENKRLVGAKVTIEWKMAIGPEDEEFTAVIDLPVGTVKRYPTVGDKATVTFTADEG